MLAYFDGYSLIHHENYLHNPEKLIQRNENVSQMLYFLPDVDKL